MHKICLLIVLVALLAPVDGLDAEDSIVLDEVIQNGVTVRGGRLVAGKPVEFRFRWTVGEVYVEAATLGFAIYTYRNGEYTGGRTPSTSAYLDDLSNYWDGHTTLGLYSVDGNARDTLKFGGFALFKPGLPPGYSEQMHAIYSGNLTAGDTLGIDSSFAPPGAYWQWDMPLGGRVYPDWSGPYLFPVVNCCDYAGDCNFDGSLSVADLSTLVRFIFPPHTPLLCAEAANVDGSSGTTPISVADVTYLVNYLFKGGPPPVPCE